MMKLAVGEIVQGYRIARFLGRGGFASVYLAEHEETRKKLALKVGHLSGGGRQVTRLIEVTSERDPSGISPDELPGEAVFLEPSGYRIDMFDASETQRMLHAEADLLESCRSPNLVGLEHRFEMDGYLALGLEYVRGKTLREKIRGLEGIHLNWFLAVARALIKLSEESAMEYHGDLKPENIVVKPSGKVVLLDPAMREDETQTITATPHYNPLLLRDSRADVVAIGIMIYEILTGTLPFDEVPWEYASTGGGGETVRMSLSYFLSYCPPESLNPRTPPELTKIVYRCLTVADYGMDDLRLDLEGFIGVA